MKLICSLTGVAVAFVMHAFTASAQVDLRKQSDSTGEYEILFCARPSPQKLPGHAFVAFSHINTSGKRDFVALGHTTAAKITDAIESLWSDPIPGYLGEENYTHLRQECLSIKVNEAAFTRAKKLTEDPLNSLGLTPGNGHVLQSYKLNADDCVAFVIRVAKTLEGDGLKVPERGAAELPMKYIERFIKANAAP